MAGVPVVTVQWSSMPGMGMTLVGQTGRDAMGDAPGGWVAVPDETALAYSRARCLVVGSTILQSWTRCAVGRDQHVPDPTIGWGVWLTG